MLLKRASLFLLCCAGPLVAQNGNGRAAATITQADIARRVGVIAHDSMRGRDTPSPELDLVAAHIGAEFRRFGLAAGGDGGSFVQHYEIQRARLDTAASRLEVKGGPTLRFGPDLVRRRGGMTAAGKTGETVLIVGTATGADAVEQLDVKDRMVLLIPRTDGAGQPTRETDRLLRALVTRGPAAVLLVVDAPDDAWRQMARGQLGESVGAAWRRAESPVVALVREQSVADLLTRAGATPAAVRADAGPIRSRPLTAPRFTLTVALEVRHADRAPNTVGILRGSDPALRDEYVVFSAHMDHVGTSGRGRCRAQGGDTICNGADDDASGTVSVMELAEAFAQLNPRPKRSMIFLTVSGEERGLWGSDYFATHPPVPIERLVANLNLDMVGRNWKDTISVIGKEHSDLGATLARVNAAHPELNMTAVDDRWPAESFYFRSDHYNFARRGVPILFFFNGTHEDYHRPSDHPEKIDAEKQARLTQLVFYLGLEIANATERPRWNPESYRTIVTGR
jgi:hypothetical protein